MNAPLTPPLRDALTAVSLDDKYTLEKGRVYMSGTQALVRLPMLQKARDRRAGLNTAGYVSGYRGSPLGALDQGLWKAKQHLKEHDVVFQPGVNEDLAATAVWGTQQLNLWPGAKVDGVFGMWYGKGPGVDRTGDVFKHANAAGTDPNGGVLVLAGDDHAAKSSSVAHQSEHMFVASGIPVLYPASVQEYLDYGLHGWAMSRYAGLWVAMKCVTDVVESSASIDIDPDRLQIVMPEDFDMPAGGLNIRWPDPPLAQEARLLNHKWYAALAYVRANKLNRVVIDSPNPRLGIMTAGKAYLDVRQALADLSLDDETCARIGIRVLKVGCVWPLDAQNARDFATGLDEILVVEEKRQILEYALKEELYNWRDDVRPKVFGKFDQRDDEGGEWSVPRGQTLLPAHYELSPALIAKAIARRLAKADLPADLRARIEARVAVIEAKEREAATPRSVTERQPWFCSGCPHNTSTRVPEGSRALAGIGCHYMSMWMDRKTETFSQMGGEGVAWTGQMHFTNERHVFVNLGDGTYFHSGLLAIRASIAAGANVTYKVLYNDAVAMTGGQPVDGVLTVPQIAFQVVAEGAKHVLIVTDEPEKYDANIRLPEGVKVYHRDELDRLQRELREMAGTSILIYDQTCATEKRRRRKRGTYPDPAKRAFINDAVCEGCGDCSVQSNCLSVEPLQTPLGTKRKINQSSCNKDFSCVNGFCPSFVTAEGAQVKKPAKPASTAALPDFAALPRPAIASLAKPYGVLVTGVGGTGVVTIGGLLGMAAHLENKGVTVLDMAGLAQKGGAVLSHVQIAAAPDQLHATRIAAGEARLILGCDAIVSASAEVLARTQRGITKAAINSGATPTAQFVRDPQWSFPADQTQQDLRASIGDDCDFIDANRLALALLGDTLYANPLLLGFVWQRGWLPLGYDSLDRAIELNGVAVEKNRLAFEWGRYVAQHGEAAADAFTPQSAKQQAIVVQMPESLDRLIERNVERLSVYQNPGYAARYVAAVERLRAKETALMGGAKPRLTPVVARNLAKLMTYKDEYEVARLYAEPAYMDKLRAQFEGEPGRDYKLAFHLAPPLLAKRDEHGHLKKQRFGQWTLTLFRVLEKFRFLRGTTFDVFGKTEERRNERELIAQYFALIDEFCATLDTVRFDTAMKLANLPDEIRGFGHVKERNVLAAAAKRERWVAEYRVDAGGALRVSSSGVFEQAL
ncbi:indolepyruvate ferredoxin oxidoreductase family protein [Paraburkholderia dipogonis]|uniref:Indolepyruvate ferredoxin oxidoreductase family protein n=1 Tax=Paraburkholderia dipogonis TaxID=1211383 RepID=A0A4Y8N1M3_9BURK|nr:indolepyruvate ferredoxin oxidoreductase family protein [Paraburkholderia dipogonis]TFE43619.1 indolepyruvate ferredoxin oxidoreductase family protein [Paraburkholderia dipogonis]